MPRANFDDVLHLPDPGKAHDPAEPPGPLAGGPVPDGEELSWIYVWIYQNRPQGGPSAAAYGESDHGVTFGGSRWDLPTEMANPSDQFVPGRQAQATAMAWVKDVEKGTKEVYWWSEAVMIGEPPEAAT
jgi:hypothetical protein